MKVCFPFVGDSIGGSHISALLLIDELCGAGIDVTIVLHEDAYLAEELRKRGYAPVLLPVAKNRILMHSRREKIFSLVRAFPRILRFLLNERFQLVHTNDTRIQTLWTLPCVFSQTSHVWHQRTKFTDSTLLKGFFGLATSHICISNFVKESCPNNVSRIGAVVVPNAVAPSDPSPEDREQKRAEILEQVKVVPTDSTVVVGIIGTLSSVKNPLDAISVLAAFSEMTNREVVGAFIGTDREGLRDQIKTEVARGGDNIKVFFSNFVSPIEPWLQACDLILACSKTDGFGRVLVEAMSVGIPVVAARGGGHSEVIRHRETGLLVDLEDPYGVASVLEELCANPIFRGYLIETGKKEASARFSPEEHMRRVLNIYKGSTILTHGRSVS